MKHLIALLISVIAFNAQADVGDKYSIFGKVGRMSEEMGVFELVGFSLSLDSDGDPATPNKVYKIQIDANLDAYGNDISEAVGGLLYGVTTNKLTVGIVYDPDDISPTTSCVGKDMEYPDPMDPINGDKVCVKVPFKDLIIK